MCKAFLLLICVAGYMAIVSCDGETNPTGETKPIEENEPYGTSSDGSRRCRCYPPICPKNEVYYNCSGGCIPRRCSEIGFLLKCDKKCTPQCVCKDGYVRADNGTCIPIMECPSCGGDKNAQQGCGNICGRTCSTYNKPPRPCPHFCIYNACDCRKGYVYDNNTKACVKPENCTPICKVNEKYSHCVNGGCDARNCSQIGKPVPCIHPKYCIKGCVCVKGYLRASNGTCVPKDQCNTYPPICPKNEVYYNCSGGCIPQRCSEIGFLLKCDKKCTPGCVCKDGYVRADNGTCIPIPKCPSCGGDKNAQQGCGINCGRFCSTYKNPPKQCPPGCIFNGCDCRKGYVYDNIKKVCVKPEDCTKICKVNEEYSPCVNCGCDARNCSQIGKPVPCRHPKYCIKGCVCVKGYLRAANGTCVPKYQCNTHPPICPKNEVYYNCSGGCIPRRCSEIGFLLKCDKKCTPGCVCKDGYVRADNGTCIPIPECPSCGGDKNAQQGCGINCGRFCSTYKNPPKSCPPGCIFNGCDCRKGYVYDNIKKVCVKPEDCTPICKVNEKYSPCANGVCIARNCIQNGKPVPCIYPKYCVKGCVCVKGYLRNSNGTCVPKDQCKSYPPICPKNEVYYNCSGGCIPRRCSEIGFLLNCDKKCTPGCVCKNGYVRADNGTCIPIPECPSCAGDKNAQQGCGINCRRFCSTYKNPPKSCPPGCIFNGCDCRKGYVYDNIKKVCVKPEDCTPICKVNEKYSTCVNGGCDARNCSQIGKPVPCIHPKYCIKGCICVKGYLRAANGTCVPKDQCKTYPPICPKNEVYYNCSGGCIPRRCSEIGFLLKCDKKCTPGCVCKDGYVRADNGTCIPIPECPSCGGDKNAQQGCGINCGRFCSTYKNPPKSCPPGCIFNGCDCRKGYVYDNIKKVCVKPEDCTPPPICPKNEVYYNCSGGCIPRRCSELGFPIKCDKKCTPRCVCKAGYVRADNGTCIPIPKCPSCGGDKNAQQGCGINCGRTCYTYKNPPKPCPPGCIFNGCDCRKGYVYDNIKKACVKPEDCTPICKVNEQYSSCANGGCEARNCSQIGKPIPCIHPKYCIKGCICIKGYLRASNGTCVPKDQCKTVPKCPVDEVYSRCSAHCGPTCENHDPNRPCTKICKPGCKCRHPLVRRKDGKCVEVKQCNSTCPPGEKYDKCYAHCQDTCENYNVTKRPCTHQCQPGCVCDKGTVRRKDGRCVPPRECTVPKCPVDEVYSRCSAHCGPTCENHDPNRPCTKICKPGCKCRHPLVRRKDGKCVEVKQCNTTCPPGEKYDKCYAHCQDTCENYNVTKRPCTHQCQPGCVCDKGTVRRKDGRCVPPRECTVPKCPVDEVYSRCSAHCGPTCENHDPNRPCTKICKPGCKCRHPLVRRKDGKCVEVKQCNSTCPPGEKYDKCYAHCQDTCENYNVTKRPCTHQCQPGCVCDKGTVRRKDGRCVPPRECTVPKCPVDEVYSRCSAHCGPTCENHDPNRPCTKICKPGCKCRHPLVRRKDGKCVEVKQCNSTCPPGEKYDKCYAHCQDTCENYNVTKRPCTHQCQPGCVCDKGTVRRKDGRCVPPRECTVPKCPVDEVYSRCSAHCGPTCENHDPNRPCTKICKPGCKCRHPLVRRKDGKCVEVKQCNSTCPPGEKYDKCYAHCQDTCENYNVTKRPCTHQCQPGCVCDKGTVRRKDGRCVPPRECTVPKCPVDEVYSRCSAHCGPTCENHDPNRPCTKICKPGCKCRHPLVRRKDGKCVEVKQCNSTCPPGEKYDKCYAHCQDTCENYNVTKRPCTHQCQPGCVCDKGTVRRKDGRCVPPRECTVPKCPVDEVYSRCSAHCGPTCENHDPNRPCTKICKPGCKCRHPLVRRKDGKCVEVKQCNSTCPPGEKYDKCYAHCQDTCENYNVTKRPCTHQCQPGCVCDKGTVRRKDGQCVPPRECTVPKCPVDEVYSRCSAHCGPTCENHDPNRPCTKICKPGCKCRHPLVRRKDGKCVEVKQCNSTCPPGEKYDKCYAHCQDTCENYNVTKRPCTHQCQPGCVCDKGTVRRKDGQCVPPRECTVPKCPVDEVYSRCSAHCGPTCENHDPNRPCTKICKPGCKCRHPLVRRKDGKCVEVKQCNSTCPPGEKYDKCYAHCQDTCENYNVTKRPCTHQCQPGCVCDKGTVRRKDGRCVPPRECTVPKCPVDEVYSRCSAHCGPTCENHDPNRPCTKICKPGCKCRHPLVRRKDGKCVEVKQCNSTCPPGEKYDKCYAHCQDTCENYNVTKRPCTHQCQPGCVCDKGTVRRKDGRCVPPRECTVPKCPVDEVYSRCSAHCGPTCENHDPNRPCTKICKPGCKCRHPLVRRKDGKCVEVKQCNSTCPPGEKYDKCYAHCQDTCENYNVTKRPCTHQCQPGCVCDKGTVRRKDGRCVPPRECTVPKCPVDEVYSRCSAHCGPTCENHDPNRPCTKICKPGCKCRHPLVRRKDGKCVEVKQCNSTCPPGEKYDKCYAHCQDTCENYNVTKRPCTHQCQPGCVCDKGTVRRKDGRCVPPRECTVPKCPVDEVYSRCSAHCGPTCENHDPNRPCTKICKPGCKCRHPLVRRKDGKCVEVKQCNSTCPPGEKYDKCYAHCQDTCENYNVTKRPCTHQCQPGCVCDKGTVRRKDGQCVPPRECTVPKCPVDEVYSRCSAHCGPTCENHDPNRPCTKICKPGCKCRHPLVRRKDGKCVEVKQCTRCYGKNEVWVNCYQGCSNQSCNDIGKIFHCPKQPAGQCKSGCRCKPGTWRNAYNVCVPQEECPKPKCPSGEIWNWCPTVKCDGDYCPKTKDSPQTCPVGIVCDKPRCMCESNRKRDWKTGKCILIQDCPKFKCGYNEEYQACPPPCPGETCSDYIKGPGRCPQIRYICRPQCRCIKDYYRSANGTCVPVCDCT